MVDLKELDKRVSRRLTRLLNELLLIMIIMFGILLITLGVREIDDTNDLD